MGEKIQVCEILLSGKCRAYGEEVRPNLHKEREVICEHPKISEI